MRAEINRQIARSEVFSSQTSVLRTEKERGVIINAAKLADSANKAKPCSTLRETIAVIASDSWEQVSMMERRAVSDGNDALNIAIFAQSIASNSLFTARKNKQQGIACSIDQLWNSGTIVVQYDFPIYLIDFNTWKIYVTDVRITSVEEEVAEWK